MKMTVKKDILILIPETEKDFYQLGILSQKVDHESTWKKEDLGGGDFTVREMRITLDTILLALTWTTIKEKK